MGRPPRLGPHAVSLMMPTGQYGASPASAGLPSSDAGPPTGSRPLTGLQPSDGRGPSTDPRPPTGHRPPTGLQPSSGHRPPTGHRPLTGPRPLTGRQPSSRYRPPTGHRPPSGPQRDGATRRPSAPRRRSGGRLEVGLGRSVRKRSRGHRRHPTPSPHDARVHGRLRPERPIYAEPVPRLRHVHPHVP